MTGLEGAATEIATLLSRLRVPYMIIGGLANLQWGAPRSTVDVDVSVWVEEKRIEAVVRELAAALRALPADPLAFVRETRVLPLKTSAGVRVDVTFAVLPVEEEAIRRAVERRIGGRPVRVCTAEDLVLHKIISDRPRDLEDIRGILRRMGGKLDRAYLDPKVASLAEAMERPEIAERWRGMLREEGGK